MFNFRFLHFKLVKKKLKQDRDNVIFLIYINAPYMTIQQDNVYNTTDPVFEKKSIVIVQNAMTILATSNLNA